MSLDPYRTLGVSPGASQDEIKRAYRRLAKAYHPDAAGQAAVPRFIAIQAAYETLIGTAPPRVGARPQRSDPWSADPERARATRDAWRARRRPGARPAGEDRSRTPGEGHPGAGGQGAADTGTESTEGTGDRKDAGARPGRGRPGRRRTARPGSTSYDDAADDPFDPEWSGASWYGTTSGTYWTLNPREYADPRKHGPEYQARGRRGPVEASIGAEPTAETGTGEAFHAPGGADVSADAGSTFAGQPSAAGSAGSTGSAREAAGAAWTAGAAAGVGTAEDDHDAQDGSVPPIPVPGVRLLRRSPRARRLALAALGWPPVAFALANVVGELTGCARSAATCEPSVGLAVVAGQLAILALLLAVPRLAWVAAVGTVAMLAVSIPAALTLSLAAGTQDPAAARLASDVLVAALSVAWVAGAAGAIGRLSQGPPAQDGPRVR